MQKPSLFQRLRNIFTNGLSRAQFAASGVNERNVTQGLDWSALYRDRYSYDRAKVLDEALLAWRLNPLARRIVELQTQYITDGIEFRCDDAATDPMHNLGFLPSTAQPPARRTPGGLWTVTTRPDFCIQDGDIVDLQCLGISNKGFALVTEQYLAPDTSHPVPRWTTSITANEIFANTAGGAMPSTIERVSNYTPLNTSNFNGILSAQDNNLQAAMDRLDDHIHARGAVPNASNINTSTGNFNGRLSAADINVQHALDTLDDHTHAAPAASVIVPSTAKLRQHPERGGQHGAEGARYPRR